MNISGAASLLDVTNSSIDLQTQLLITSDLTEINLTGDAAINIASDGNSMIVDGATSHVEITGRSPVHAG